MLNFEKRTGPVKTPTVKYPKINVPQWYKEAKLGFFIHWGLYSVPGWAFKPDHEYEAPVEQAYALHEYAEWYGNTVKIIGSPCYEYHVKHYGSGFSYEDFADIWQVKDKNIDHLIEKISKTLAGYVVPTAKHHDGFCLWNTQTTPFNSVRKGPHIDLIKLISEKVRDKGMRLGLYFSGALDWHVSSFSPIVCDYDLFTKRRNDRTFADYAALQLTELIDKFNPDLLWNDIEWPDSGKGTGDLDLAAVFRYYLKKNPHAVINDRWGIPAHGFLTREYSNVETFLDQYWEATRGIGHSFGYNCNEDPKTALDSSGLSWLLVDTVAKGGNLLINIGPKADGSLDEIQEKKLDEFASWCSRYMPFLKGSETFDFFSDNINPKVRYLRKDDSIIIFVFPHEENEKFYLPECFSSQNLIDSDGRKLEIDSSRVVDLSYLSQSDEDRRYKTRVLQIPNV